jgi:hypothetical protein
MALPAKLQKVAKRASRWKSQAHRDFVRGHACSNCGSTSGVQFAHVRMGSGAGMGQKPDDFCGVSLCGPCHNGDQHTKLGEPAFWAAYESKSGQSVWKLMDAFCAASPKASEIRQIKRERGLV